MNRPMKRLLLSIVVITAIGGCDPNENRQLAEMAERNLERQHAQAHDQTELQHEVTEGTRRLVQANAEARQEIITSQRELQATATEVDRQRDALEQERKQIATDRHRDPIVAESIQQLGLLLACLLPLLVSLFLLRQPPQPVDDSELAELLIVELTSAESVLLPSAPSSARLEENSHPRPTLESHEEDVSD